MSLRPSDQHMDRGPDGDGVKLPQRYVLIAREGIGGAGTVYRAHDTHLDRTVAIKVLHPHLAGDPVAATRVEHEAATLRRLDHAGAVRVYDTFREADAVGVVMEWVPGGDLRRRILLGGPLPPDEATTLAVALLETLAAAHRIGIIHRDIKPRNILFDEAGLPKIADFGLAVGAAGGLRDDAPVGTAEYTAPETSSAGLWDARTDLYALGCTLFEALTGTPPFTAPTPREVAQMHRNAVRPTPAAEQGGGAPIGRLVAWLIAQDPNRRFQSAEEAIRSLQNEADDIGEERPAGETECPWCGRPMSAEYGWCFSCGRATTPARFLRTGGQSVLLNGPGKAGDKLRPEARDRLCDALESLGIDSGSLRKRLPRVPLLVVRGVDRSSASRLQEALASAGLDATIHGGKGAPNREITRAVARKTASLTPRIYLIALGTAGGTFGSLASTAPAAIGVYLASMVLLIPAITAAAFLRPAGRRRAIPGDSQPPDEVESVLLNVTDPLLHARMSSVVSAAGCLREAAAGSPDAEQVADAAAVACRRAAGLILALSDAASARGAASRAIIAGGGQTAGSMRAAAIAQSDVAQSPGRGPGDRTADADVVTALRVVREAEGITNRTLADLNSLALEMRSLAARYRRLAGNGWPTSPGGTPNGTAQDIAARLAEVVEEIEARRELEAYLEGSR